MQKLVSLQLAKTRGLKVYFTGIPCKRGHIAERRVSSRMCVRCDRENCAQWQRANAEWVRNHNREYMRLYMADPKKRARVNKRVREKEEQEKARTAGMSRPLLCEACGESRTKIRFDHCHRSSRFRGWLCNNCNVALGLMYDSAERLRKLAAYAEARCTPLDKMEPREGIEPSSAIYGTAALPLS